MSSSLSKKIIKNTLFNILNVIVSFPITIIIIPYIILKIGISEFGIWALISIFIGQKVFLDLGLSTTIEKFVAQYYASEKYDELNSLINTSSAIYVVLSIFYCLILYYSKNWIINSFLISEGTMIKDINFIYMASVLIFVFHLPLSIFQSILNGLQRMDITNTILIIKNIFYFSGIFIFLSLGYGIKGLVVNSGICILLVVTSSAYFCRKLLPKLVFNPFLFELGQVKRLLVFGFQIMIGQIGDVVNAYADKFIIAYFLNTTLVGFYEAAFQVIFKLRIFLSLILSPIMPASSEIHEVFDKNTFKELYQRSIKYLTFLGLPIFIFITVLASSLVEIWLGKGYGYTINTLKILLLVNFFNLLTGPAFMLFIGIGKPKNILYCSSLGIILNIALSLSLVLKFGYYGVVIGSFLTLLLASSYLLFLFHNGEKISFYKTFLKPIITPLWISSLLIIIVRLCFFYLGGINHLILLILLSCFYLVGYIILILKFKYFDAFDFKKFEYFVPLKPILLPFWNRLKKFSYN